MSGLDPFGRRDVRDLILEQRARGATVLFSSHILPDVEMLCDRVAILLEGRLSRVATVGELVREGAGRVEVRCCGSPIVEVPVEWEGTVTREQRGGSAVFTLHDRDRLQTLLAWLVEHRVTIEAVTPMRASLEELFMATAEHAAIHGRNQRRSA
jgi:ABC-2 type transport system ATP-binding protein